MTAQIGDVMFIDGEKKSVMGELSVNMRYVEVVDDNSLSCTACWREYVAMWEVRESEIYLKNLAGILRLISNEPVKAVWLNGFVRIIDGNLVRYVHGDYLSKYDAVLELQIEAGKILRQRRLTAPQHLKAYLSGNPEYSGFSYYTRAWKYLPETAVLFPPECTPEDAYQGAPDPMTGEPDYKHFIGGQLRRRITAERNARGLKYGAMAALAGYSSTKGGRLAQWERGQKGIDPEMEERLCEVLGISEPERMVYHQQDCMDYRTAWHTWADEAIMPTLKVYDALRCFCYAAPVAYREHSRRLVEWAKACVNITWRPTELIITRRNRLYFDSHGIQKEMKSGPLKVPDKFKVSIGNR